MPRTRPPGPAFWTEAVRLAREPGNTIRSVARDLGVSYEGLRRYVHQADVDAGKSERLTSDERADLATNAAAWIHAGGSHHTILGFDVSPALLRDLAAMRGIELVLLDENTRLDDLGERLRWSDRYWQLAKGL